MTGFDKRRCVWTAALVLLLAATLSAAAPGIAIADDTQAPSDGQSAASDAGAAPQAPEKPAPPATGLAFPPQPLPPAVDKRGLLKDMGRWWDESFTDFNSRMKDARQKLDDMNKKSDAAAKDAAAATQEAMKNAAEATKNAATAVVRLPNTRLIEIHQACAAAPNGAPDCQAAATQACLDQGFVTGQPLDVRTADKCPASLWISGQVPAAGQCPVETVVLRAVCQ